MCFGPLILAAAGATTSEAMALNASAANAVLNSVVATDMA